jgi:methylated-DNA-[protein]-cysteine S-methyltransferase
LRGTDFQKSVWHCISTIPYGQTRTYGQIARELGNPDAARAVGMANRANPIPIVVPCHRVVQSNGKLGGYSGGLHLKDALLRLEGVIF